MFEALRDAHPVIGHVLEYYRQLTKLKSTYLDALPTKVNPLDRAHPHVIRTDRRGHRAALVKRPQLAEHPHSHRDEGRKIRKAFVAGASEPTSC